jgi:hypothetical protein
LTGPVSGCSSGGNAETTSPLSGAGQVYDETIRVLKSAVQNAKLGRDEEMQAIKRLDNQAR